MNKKILKNILLIIGFIFVSFIFSNKVEAAYVSISLSSTNANPGEQITGSVSSDCVGRVNLSVSNGSISTDRVWIEGGAQSFTITVGTAGTTSISATPHEGTMSFNRVDVPVEGASALISVAAASNTGGTTSNENSGTGTTSGGSNTNPQTPTQPTTTSNNTTKSNNANLGNFGIRPNDFTGFTPSKTEYSTTVPNNVTSIEVYATKGQSGQTITGTGTKELQEGENTFKVVVTAENGTTQKTYTLTVTREAVAEENSEETPEVGATELTEGFGLSNLEIEGVELSPRFSTDVYEYTAKYTGDANQLNIKTTPTEEGTNVEITGNENIVDGENLITILVTDSSGDKTVAYQITVQKQTIDEEAIAKQEELEKQQQMRNYIIIGGVAFLVIVIIIILIIRHRRNVRLAEEYTVPYSGLDDDDYYDDNNYDNDYDEDDYQKVTKKFLNNDKNQETTENNDKEKIKDSYLEQFDNEENDYEEERPRKKHNKGKRYR